MRGRLPLVYHPHYSCSWPSAHKFPMRKFADLHAFLRTQGSVLEASEWHAPEREAPVEWLDAVHETNYSRAFLGGQLSEAETRRIGFGAETRRPELIRRTLLEVAGTVLTARLALRSGLACNLAGGTHHAHASFGSGFTILNDLAVATAYVRTHEAVERVLIVDLDVHQGDGARDIRYRSKHTIFLFQDGPLSAASSPNRKIIILWCSQRGAQEHAGAQHYHSDIPQQPSDQTTIVYYTTEISTEIGTEILLSSTKVVYYCLTRL